MGCLAGSVQPFNDNEQASSAGRRQAYSKSGWKLEFLNKNNGRARSVHHETFEVRRRGLIIKPGTQSGDAPLLLDHGLLSHRATKILDPAGIGAVVKSSINVMRGIAPTVNYAANRNF